MIPHPSRRTILLGAATLFLPLSARADDWFVVHSAAPAFEVAFPQKPTESIKEVQKRKVHLLSETVGTVTYACTFTRDIPAAERNETTLVAAAAQVAKTVNVTSPKALHKITLGGKWSGLRCALETPDRRLDNHLFIIGDTLYHQAVGYPKSTASKAVTDDVDRFFASLNVNG